MKGVVKFFNIERDFGFIRYASQPSSVRLDREIYFSGVNLRGSVNAGDQVIFEISDLDGKQRAVEVTPVEATRFTGTVIYVSKRQYGFIAVDGRYEDNQRIFFAHDDVLPDVIGRRGMPEGSRVSFEIADEHKCDRRERAVNIRNEDPALVQIDPKQYREYGQIHRCDGDYGHVIRPNGDHLSFLVRNIVSEGRDTIQVGTWLNYGIVQHLFLFDKVAEQFRHRVFADNIFVCLEGENSQPMLPIEQAPPGSVEQFFMTAPELQLSEPSVPAPPASATYTSVLLSPENRTKTLRQLIAEKKLAA